MHRSMPIFQKYQEPFTDTLRYLVNNNPKDFPNTQFGITPLNYYQEHQHHYQEDSYAFPKMKLKRYQKLWPNIYREEPFDLVLGHMRQTYSLSKRKMESYAQYKTIVLLTNGRKRTAMYPR